MLKARFSTIGVVVDGFNIKCYTGTNYGMDKNIFLSTIFCCSRCLRGWFCVWKRCADRASRIFVGSSHANCGGGWEDLVACVQRDVRCNKLYRFRWVEHISWK